MNNKTIEILIHLLGHLREHEFDFDSLNEFSENLVFNGYNENDIAEAIGWLLDRLSIANTRPSEVARQQDHSVRILSDHERMQISPDVYGYLLNLRANRIITPPQMEKIIDYCMMMGGRLVTEEDVNEILVAILFENQARKSNQTET